MYKEKKGKSGKEFVEKSAKLTKEGLFRSGKAMV